MTLVNSKDEITHIYDIKLEGLHANERNDLSLDDESIDILAESIKTLGLWSPLIVYPDRKVGGYTISSGHRRYLAVKKLGWDSVPCVVADAPKSEYEDEVRLLEANICRNSDDQIQELIKKAEVVYEKLPPEEKEKERAKLLKVYKEKGKDPEQFRFKLEFIKARTGINLSTRQIQRLLKEDAQTDAVEEANLPEKKEKKKRKTRSFEDFAKAAVLELRYFESEEAEDLLDDNTLNEIDHIIALLSKYLPKEN